MIFFKRNASKHNGSMYYLSLILLLHCIIVFMSSLVPAHVWPQSVCTECFLATWGLLLPQSCVCCAGASRVQVPHGVRLRQETEGRGVNISICIVLFKSKKKKKKKKKFLLMMK